MILFNLFLKKLNNLTFDGMGINRSYQLFYALLILLCVGCTEKKKTPAMDLQGKESVNQYATGFSIKTEGDITIIEVTSAWPGSDTHFTYALVPKEKLASMTLPSDAYDAVVATPVERMVITSTTHIPSLEALGELETVVGFPNTDLISSPNTRKTY